MIAILGALVRFLLFLLLARLVVRALAPLAVSRPQAAPPQRTAGELVRDRICRTFFPRDRAVRATIGGEEQLFCSAACADRARLGS